MTTKTYTLRAGLLVGLSTTMVGNVTYRKEDIPAEHKARMGGDVAAWKTERTIADKAEHERAKVIRSQAVYAVRKVCASTAFGYLCPSDRQSELGAAVAEAHSMIDRFNETAKATRLGFYVITGRIEPGDAEAARAINAEVRALLDAMTAGALVGDAKAIRDAADKAKAIAAMLADGDAVETAIVAARSLARGITKTGSAPVIEDPKVADEPADETEDYGKPKVSTVETKVDVKTSDAERALAALRDRKRAAKAAMAD